MKNQNSINILGCVPSLLNVLLELIDDSIGIKVFDIHKNIPIKIDDSFISDKNWLIKEYDHSSLSNFENSDIFALSVVGTNSKSIVFEFFKSLLGYDKKQFINLIHHTSYVSPSVKLNFGLQLEPLSTIAACTKIGFAVNIKRNSNIGHHCFLDDYVTINPGVTISSNVKIGLHTMVGSGTSIKNNVTIGKKCVIGVGSVVVKNIPDNSIAFGNPCKVVRQKED